MLLLISLWITTCCHHGLMPTPTLFAHAVWTARGEKLQIRSKNFKTFTKNSKLQASHLVTQFSNLYLYAIFTSPNLKEFRNFHA